MTKDPLPTGLDHSASIAGPDANADGIRDDVAQIIGKFPIPESEKAQALVVARTLQSALLDTGSDTQAETRALEMYAAVEPLSASPNATFALHRVTAYTVNTPARFAAYLDFQKKIGTSVLRPEANRGRGRSLAQIRSREADLCQASGFVVTFINGVLNDPLSAINSYWTLRSAVGESLGPETIEYQPFYNPTDGALADVGESIRQSLQEQGVTQYLELFWAVVLDDGPLFDTVIGALSVTDPSLAAKVLIIRTALREIVARVASSVGPDAARVTNELVTKIYARITERKKVLLVAHSQGNFFAGAAYRAIAPTLPESSLGVVHVATPTSTASGPYTTSSNDYVMALARLGSGALPSNIDIPFTTVDFLGHGFDPIYMSPLRNGRAKILGDVRNTLASLVAPSAGGESGFFSVEMRWDGPGDVDLHVIEPDGNQVYYRAMMGHSGELDVDNVVGEGPEHYYATCESGALQTGVYRVGVNNFNKATGRRATFVFTAPDRVYSPITVDVGPERGPGGDSAPNAVFDILVERTPDGLYTASLVGSGSRAPIRTNAPNRPKGRP